MLDSLHLVGSWIPFTTQKQAMVKHAHVHGSASAFHPTLFASPEEMALKTQSGAGWGKTNSLEETDLTFKKESKIV